MKKKWVALGVFVFLAVAIGNPFSMAWLAGRLVVADGLEPADAVIPLRSFGEEERLRLEEAARVAEGYAPLLLVSVYSLPYYGEPMRNLVEAYLRNKGFPAEKLAFCENQADNTAEEAQALFACAQQWGAQQVIVVTSEYHTRRTRAIFRRVFSGSGIAVRVHPVYNSDYWDPHWWRRRRWAKTFLLETLALAWSAVEGLRSSPPSDTASATGAAGRPVP